LGARDIAHHPSAEPTMRFVRVLLVAFSLLLFAGVVQARKAELVEPAPISIPAGLDQAQVAKEIKRALIGRGWEVTGEQPGQIDSTLHLRDHVASIRIAYDASEVRTSYVGSTNLDYAEKRGKRYIHGNYLGWIGFLVNDITTNFKVTAQGG
jgi:hypothetical protein